MFPVAFLPQLAEQNTREALSFIKKANRVFNKDDQRAFGLYLASADRLERAAHDLRAYVEQLKQS